MNRESHLSTCYPVFLKINGRRCVVVGGGQVALRKVRSLLEHGANVDVISPELCPELEALAKGGQIRILPRNYQAGDLEDAFIAIAATDDSTVNLTLVEEARIKKVLVNIVDDAENSNFIVPSSLRRGDITIAVSTTGRSPALARKIRSRLENDFGDEYASLALLLDEVRTQVKKQDLEISNDSWQEALDLDLLTDLLRRGNGQKVKSILLHNLGVSLEKD